MGLLRWLLWPRRPKDDEEDEPPRRRRKTQPRVRSRSHTPGVYRIVVIGDTGCRLKTGEEYQSCNDAEKYQFGRIAATAAQWKPDLVVHVGDYLYRENACPQADSGCAGQAVM